MSTNKINAEFLSMIARTINPRPIQAGQLGWRRARVPGVPSNVLYCAHRGSVAGIAIVRDDGRVSPVPRQHDVYSPIASAIECHALAMLTRY